MQKHRNTPYTAEELVLIQSCLDDGWPFSEIYKTYGFYPKTVQKHFPGCGMPVKEAAALGWLVRKFNQGTLKGKTA